MSMLRPAGGPDRDYIQAHARKVGEIMTRNTGQEVGEKHGAVYHG
jgi:hypothetical protein